MSFKSPKTDWSVVDGIAYDDLNRIEGNIQSLGIIPLATGTGTNILLDLDNISNMQNGTIIQFIANANNGGAATLINSRHLYKPGSTESPNLTNGRAYSAWYNKTGDCFFIKASAEGTATPSDVLAGKTFSNDSDSGIVGTYVGVDTSNATALAADMLIGKIAYSKGAKVVGTAPAKATTTITPSTANQTVAAGTMLTGLLTILGSSDLLAGNIKSGVNIFGVVGNLTAATFGARQVATGYTSSSSGYLYISGFSFYPTYVVAICISDLDSNNRACVTGDCDGVGMNGISSTLFTLSVDNKGFAYVSYGTGSKSYGSAKLRINDKYYYNKSFFYIAIS